MASTTALASPQDSDAWALLALKEATASPAKQQRESSGSAGGVPSNTHTESLSVSASVENNDGNLQGETNSSSENNLPDNFHPHLQFTERGTGGGETNGHHKAPIAKLKGKEFEFLVRQNRLVIGRNSSTKGIQGCGFM